MKAKIPIALAAGFLGLFFQTMSLEAAAPTAAGLWQQTDDDGHVGGWFLIFRQGDVYQGALVKMFPKPGEDPNPICTKCEGDQKNLPSLGLIMIKGMQRHGSIYENGTILDPRDGSVYNAQMTVSQDGQELTVRGYLGIQLFGKSQVWTRLPNDRLSPEETPPNLAQYLPAPQ